MRSTRCGASYITVVRGSAAIAASRLARSRPDRGRKPSNTNRVVSNPLTTRAITNAVGPGHGRHRVPGVEHDAHEPRARVGDPRRAGIGDQRDGLSGVEQRQHLAAALGLGVLVADGESHAADAGMRRATCREWRVSSHRISDELCNVSTARRDRSPRLPMGVATRTSVPVIRAPPRHRRRADPSGRTRLLAPRSPFGPATPGAPMRWRRMCTVLTTMPCLVDVGDVEGEAHAERVHPSTTLQHQRPFDPSRPSSPRLLARRCVTVSHEASTRPSVTNHAMIVQPCTFAAVTIIVPCRFPLASRILHSGRSSRAVAAFRRREPPRTNGRWRRWGIAVEGDQLSFENVFDAAGAQRAVMSCSTSDSVAARR